MCQPQFHLLRPWKKASSRLTQAGWYTLGQPLRSQTTRSPPSKQMKHTTSSSSSSFFRAAACLAAAVGAAAVRGPVPFLGGLPLLFFGGGAIWDGGGAVAGGGAGSAAGWARTVSPIIDPRKCESSSIPAGGPGGPPSMDRRRARAGSRLLRPSRLGARPNPEAEGPPTARPYCYRGGGGASRAGMEERGRLG